MGLLCTAILVVNNLRDIDTDRRAGKRTLAVRIGRPATRALFTGCLVISYLVPPLLWLFGPLTFLALLPLATIPLALNLNQLVWTQTAGPPLIAALKASGRLHLFFGLLFAVSLLILRNV